MQNGPFTDDFNGHFRYLNLRVPTIYKAYILEFPLMIHIVGDLVYKNGEFPVRYVSLPATVGCTDFGSLLVLLWTPRKLPCGRHLVQLFLSRHGTMLGKWECK